MRTLSEDYCMYTSSLTTKYLLASVKSTERQSFFNFCILGKELEPNKCCEILTLQKATARCAHEHRISILFSDVVLACNAVLVVLKRREPTEHLLNLWPVFRAYIHSLGMPSKV